MYREDWSGVFINQDKILKQLKPLENKLFLAGGTRLQRFALKKAYRHSEDLDFFLSRLFSKKELDDIKDELLALMSNLAEARLEDLKWFKDEKSWRIWYNFDNNEPIKIEILNFTCKRIKDLSFVNLDIFKTENLYNLLLYKFKALCDRPDTIKDLFDIYFLLRDLPNIKISTLIKDINAKFEKAIGIRYSKENIINSLNHNLQWDIEIGKHIVYVYDLKLEINTFKKELQKAFKSATFLDFSYKSKINKKAKKLNLTSDEYIQIVEDNQFIINEWRKSVRI